jgi:hypothetical protein
MSALLQYLRLIIEAKRPLDRAILVVGLLVLVGTMLLWSLSLRGDRSETAAGLSADRVVSAQLSGAYGSGAIDRGVLQANVAAAGQLADDSTDVWTFAGVAGKRITITLDAPWAGHLELARPDEFGRMHEAYNDLGGGLAIICNKELPVTGDYRVFVSESASRPETAGGPYTLIVQVAPEDSASADPAPEVVVTDTSVSIAVRSACGDR